MRSVAGSLNRFCSTLNKNPSTKLAAEPSLPIPKTRITLCPGMAHMSNVLSLINEISFRIIRIKYSNQEMLFKLLKKKRHKAFSNIFHSIHCFWQSSEELTAAFQFSDFNIAFDRCCSLYISGLFLSLILQKVPAQLDLVFTVSSPNKMIT